MLSLTLDDDAAGLDAGLVPLVSEFDVAVPVPPLLTAGVPPLPAGDVLPPLVPPLLTGALPPLAGTEPEPDVDVTEPDPEVSDPELDVLEPELEVVEPAFVDAVLPLACRRAMASAAIAGARRTRELIKSRELNRSPSRSIAAPPACVSFLRL